MILIPEEDLIGFIADSYYMYHMNWNKFYDDDLTEDEYCRMVLVEEYHVAIEDDNVYKYMDLALEEIKSYK